MVIYLSLLGILGAIFGSFASALIPRLKSGRNMTHERSECPHCEHTLSWYDLIPVISWLSTFGKCRYCHTSIPLYHISLEVVMILSFIGVGYFLGGIPTDTLGYFHIFLGLTAAFVGVVIVFYDLLYMEIPDAVVLPYIGILGITLGVSQFIDWNFFGYFIAFDSVFLSSPLINAALGAGLIYTFFYLQIVISK